MFKTNKINFQCVRFSQKYRTDETRRTGILIFEIDLFLVYNFPMLNIFPSFLWLSLLAPFILRVTLGLVFVNAARLKLTKDRIGRVEIFEKIGLRPGNLYALIFGLLELAIGIFLVIGLFTQLVSLLGAIIMGVTTFLKAFKKPDVFKGTLELYILLTVMAISLLFSGAGAWAFDMPL
jgi:putative oxidoreductase